MKRIKKIRNKHSLHPIFSYCLLIFAIIVLSGVLNLFNVNDGNKLGNKPILGITLLCDNIFFVSLSYSNFITLYIS